MELKEIKIGRTGWIRGKTIKCFEQIGQGCKECLFRKVDVGHEKCHKIFRCCSADRFDGMDVFYREVPTEFSKIKTFQDVLDVLGMDSGDTLFATNVLSVVDGEDSHLASTYKLDLIRKALGKPDKEDWVYLPPLYLKGSKDEIDFLAFRGFIDLEGETYTVNLQDDCLPKRKTEFSPSIGLLGCKSQEIALHFGYYFWKEIIEFIYPETKKEGRALELFFFLFFGDTIITPRGDPSGGNPGCIFSAIYTDLSG